MSSAVQHLPTHPKSFLALICVVLGGLPIILSDTPNLPSTLSDPLK